MSLDDVRADVLNRMERGERAVRLGVLGAAIMEMLLLLAAITLMNWSDPLHRLLFVLSVCGYTIVVLGLVALGGHVSRVGGRIVAAMEPGERL
jgi:hypothetical protein